MDGQNKILKEMINGYGTGFPDLESLFGMRPYQDQRQKMLSPVSLIGRYGNSVSFMENITSGKAIGISRFDVIKRYLFALSKFMDEQKNIPDEKKIIHGLTAAEEEEINKLCNTLEEVFQAEQIEKFTEHDTAAAGDFAKLRLATRFQDLATHLEAICFAETSEDTMSIVFGCMANKLILGHLTHKLATFCGDMLGFVDSHEENGPLLLPELTHLQPAEPTTHRIKVTTRVQAIITLLHALSKPFSGKMGGAIGNLTCHYAAYPDVNWEKFARKYVESFGLQYEKYTDQCVSYINEAQHFTTIAHILTEIIKLTEDFIDMASAPAQFFIKKKKKGTKGSSIMPNKSNAWAMEGAVAMLKKSRNALMFLAETLPGYPQAGNMARSFLFRELGTDLMPIFIGLDRITKEMKNYVPCPKKIEAFFNEYPGMAGSALQTVMKRMKISGDAYRVIESIAINPDGSYANSEDFQTGLEQKMVELQLSNEQKTELLNMLNPNFLVAPAQRKAEHDLPLMSIELLGFKNYAQKFMNS
ncbi:MAG: lyase family protein [Patescibacteria group bacterium]